MVVHPIRAQTELAGGFRDAGPESLLRIGKIERAILGYEGAVDIVDVLGALAVGEQEVEDHDGAAGRARRGGLAAGRSGTTSRRDQRALT